MEDFAEKLVRPIDAYGWLWYSRRLHPSIFQGELQTTAPVDWLIFEMMGARSRRSGPYRSEDDRGLYPWDDESLRQVLRLAALAVHYSETAGILRRAGKGATVAAHLDHLPRSVPDSDLEFYIQLVDQRAAEDVGFSGGTKMLADLTPSSSGGGLLVVARTYGLQEVPGWTGKLSDGAMLTIKGSFVPLLRSLDALEEMFGGTGLGVAAKEWWHPSLPALIVLLRSLTLHVFTVSEVAGMTLPKVGYLLASPPYVEAMLDACLPAASEGLANLFPSSALPSSGAEVLAQCSNGSPA